MAPVAPFGSIKLHACGCLHDAGNVRVLMLSVQGHDRKLLLFSRPPFVCDDRLITLRLLSFFAMEDTRQARLICDLRARARERTVCDSRRGDQIGCLCLAARMLSVHWGHQKITVTDECGPNDRVNVA